MTKTKKNSKINRPKTETDSLVWPLARVLVIVSLNIFFWQLVRSSNSETWDKIIYVTSLGLGFLLIPIKSQAWSKLNYVLLGTASLLVGVIGVEKHGTQTTSGVDVTGLLWLGYGPIVFGLLILIYPFCFKLLDWQRLNKPTKWFLRSVAIVVIFFSLLSCWQTGSSIIDMYSSEYVLNEALAVPAGNLPYVNFIPQYGTLFSFIAQPARTLFTPDGLVTFILIQHFVICIISILLGALIVRKSFANNNWTIPLLLVVPFTCLTHLPNRKGFAGSIFDLIQEIPIRLFFGILIGMATVAALNYKNLKGRNIYSLVSGVLSGIGIWINQDFIFLAGLIALGFITLLSKNIKQIGFVYLGYFLGFILYPIWVLTQGKTVNFKFFGFFVVQYTGGFMAEPIITPGPVLIILPLIAGLAFLSFFKVLKFTFSKQSVVEEDRQSWHTILFYSAWCVGGFLYYLNRSYASGQMQTLFLPLAIAFGSYLGIFLKSEYYKNTWELHSFFNKKYWKDNSKSKIALIPLAVVTSLFLSTTIAAPSPNIELKRINNAPDALRWPSPTGRIALANYEQIKLNNPFPNQKIAYFGASGNYVQLATGIQSVNILNSPWDIPVTQTTIITGCDAISDVDADILLLGPEALALFRFKDNTLCEKYKFISVPGFKDGTFAGKI